MINVVILVGRLTKDAELQMTGSGKKLCRFTLACNTLCTRKHGCRETIPEGFCGWAIPKMDEVEE